MPAKTETYVTETYELLNLPPCAGYQAVWACEWEARPDRFRLYARPLHLLGVARVTEQRWRIIGGNSTKAGEPLQYNTVVGVEVSEGYFQICNECSNFAGICRKGEDIYESVGELSGGIRAALDRPEAPA